MKAPLVNAFLRALLMVTILGTSLSAQAAGRQVPKSIALKGLKGGKLVAKDLSGKMTVMMFWASWCQGCGEVMGELAPIVANYEGALFLPVSVDESIGEAKGYFKKQKDNVKSLEAKAYLDQDAKLASALKVEALPAVAIVDEDGNVVRSYTGHLDAKQLGEIKKLLGAAAE